MSMYSLRAHHGLCIQFFGGKGYDAAFTENMEHIVSMLEKDSPDIVLTAGGDIICAACPNMDSAKCASQEKVMRYDRKVLEICTLKEGQVISAKKFLASVRSEIIEAGRINEVCGDCEWGCGSSVTVQDKKNRL